VVVLCALVILEEISGTYASTTHKILCPSRLRPRSWGQDFRTSHSGAQGG
jgi:hypothetical protein